MKRQCAKHEFLDQEICHLLSHLPQCLTVYKARDIWIDDIGSSHELEVLQIVARIENERRRIIFVTQNREFGI